MSEKRPVTVSFTAEFLRRLKQLQKRYRRIRDDIKPLIQSLEAGQTPGDQIPGLSYTVYKVRVANRDAQRGKSGGYRVIYYLHTPHMIYLVTVFSKTEFEDIADAYIAASIGQLSFPPEDTEPPADSE